MSILVVQHEADAPAGLLIADDGPPTHVVRPYQGEDLPPSVAGHSGLIVLGGEMNAYQDAEYPWLAPTKGLIREAIGAGIPTLLVCLGHQLGAVALGGTVERHPDPLWGVFPVRLTDAGREDPLFAHLRADARVVHWNGDLVTVPPAGATVLAHDPRGGIQVLRYGPRAWGVQCHPEVDVDIVGSWAASQSEEREAGSVARAEAAMVEIRREMPAVHRAWAPVLAAFADLATPR
ncbi:type 1 glutamine amidotransferase [Mobilicoccus caccae]|uniref:Aminotransferase n=1 Tax=Mobilicoccus caccae TaxID=1859295 RepID=A0ABQ6ILI4_9MICO|nr:type 1 glutamine amidotransferase [Mobilicoccus caccae]GMA38799.1 aminotransferase [Mobilicoccus caccae]